MSPFIVGADDCCDANGDAWLLCAASLSRPFSSSGLCESFSPLVAPIGFSGFDLLSGELATIYYENADKNKTFIIS